MGKGGMGCGERKYESSEYRTREYRKLDYWNEI